MVEIRNRKGEGSTLKKKRVSFALEEEKPQTSSFVKQLLDRKLYITGICISIFVLAIVLWPPPKLSRHAQNWHDSGFIFKFRQFDIFYQDILRIKKPIEFQPALVIFHGFPTSSYDWKNLIPELQKRFARIIIPDMLGLGFSDKPKGHLYTVSEQATMFEELLAYLNVTVMHMLAHDYGDTIVQELLARDNDPNRKLNFAIKSVCLSNGGIIPTEYHPRPIQKALLIPGIKHLLVLLTNRFLYRSRLSAVFGPDTQPSQELVSDYWAILLQKDGHLVISEILAYLQERQTYKDRWIGALKETDIPLHLIYGPMDPINRPDGFFKLYKEYFQRSSYTVLENIGHYPQVEDKKGFLSSYDQFLNKVKLTFTSL